MSNDIAAILNKPSDFGFEFVTETVKKASHSFPNVPLIVVRDLAKFDAAFPGVATKALDGSSIRVSGQRIVRDAAYDGVKDTNELKMRLVRWLLGIEQPQAIYVGPEGRKFATEQEAEEAWIEFVSNK